MPRRCVALRAMTPKAYHLRWCSSITMPSDRQHCQVSEAPYIIKGLSNAHIKKLMVVDGGAN